jgi:hypothetical protein
LVLVELYRESLDSTYGQEDAQRLFVPSNLNLDECRPPTGCRRQGCLSSEALTAYDYMITPQMRVLMAIEPVDFGVGSTGL